MKDSHGNLENEILNVIWKFEENNCDTNITVNDVFNMLNAGPMPRAYTTIKTVTATASTDYSFDNGWSPSSGTVNGPTTVNVTFKADITRVSTTTTYTRTISLGDSIPETFLIVRDKSLGDLNGFTYSTALTNGNLPNGMTFTDTSLKHRAGSTYYGDAQFSISGTANAVGVYTFTVTATATGTTPNTVNCTFTLNVTSNVSRITTITTIDKTMDMLSTLSDIMLIVRDSSSQDMSGYTYSTTLQSGTLPTGMTFVDQSTNNRVGSTYYGTCAFSLSGTPTIPDTYTFVVRATATGTSLDPIDCNVTVTVNKINFKVTFNTLPSDIATIPFVNVLWGTEYTVNGNTITFSDGQTVTAPTVTDYTFTSWSTHGLSPIKAARTMNAVYTYNSSVIGSGTDEDPPPTSATTPAPRSSTRRPGSSSTRPSSRSARGTTTSGVTPTRSSRWRA